MTKGKFYYGSNALTLSLAIIAAGTLLTIARRTLRIARRLREAQ
jgi:hypothetical protein